jgi:hypothetical protein
VLKIHSFFDSITLKRERVWVNSIFPLIFLCFMVSGAFAQNTNLIFAQPDTFGIGPRAIGMGGAFAAVADDASAAYWNVAGLAQISSYELSLSSAPVYFTNDLNGIPAFGFLGTLPCN